MIVSYNFIISSLFTGTCFIDLQPYSNCQIPPLVSRYLFLTVFNKQINMDGGKSSNYLRLTRASSGPRVSIAKTYRDETKRKFRPNHSGLSQQYCWGRPLWSGRNIHFRFVSSLYVLTMLTRGPYDALVSLRYVPLCPLPYLFVSCLSRFSILYTTIFMV